MGPIPHSRPRNFSHSMLNAIGSMATDVERTADLFSKRKRIDDSTPVRSEDGKRSSRNESGFPPLGFSDRREIGRKSMILAYNRIGAHGASTSVEPENRLSPNREPSSNFLVANGENYSNFIISGSRATREKRTKPGTRGIGQAGHRQCNRSLICLRAAVTDGPSPC